MTLQKSKVARRVAEGTASYLVLAVTVIVVGIGSPLSLLFLPNILGFIVMIGLYTGLAYVLTRSIERSLSHRT